jgi:hypothetical protein
MAVHCRSRNFQGFSLHMNRLASVSTVCPLACHKTRGRNHDGRQHASGQPPSHGCLDCQPRAVQFNVPAHQCKLACRNIRSSNSHGTSYTTLT